MRAVHSRHRSRRAIAALAAGALAATGLATTAVTGAGADPLPKETSKSRPVADTVDAGPKVHKQSKVTLDQTTKSAFRKSAQDADQEAQAEGAAADAGTGGVPVGGEKIWMISDDHASSGYAPASYVLQALGENIEVWVQKDLDYPEGDCRNDGVRNVVTREQAESLAAEFDTNMLPEETETFSTAPARDGSKQADAGFGAPLWQLLGDGDENYFTGDGDKTIALISNVRDDNFYEPNTPAGATFIAGFFSPLYNEAFDRNVMTVDSYDWLHRTGVNPPSDGAGGLCSTGQPGRPRAYEGTFAHEYQHLLEYYRDSDETTWLNEGLSDYAQTLTGYADTTIPYGQTGADGHISCYQGFYGSDSFPYCGAEDSITRWEDQGSNSTLADYGSAYAFMTYLENQFGRRAISYLHNSKATGLASLQKYLDDYAPGLKSTDVVHDFLAQMALDRLVDNGAKGLTRDQKARFTAPELSSAIDWAWTGSYDSPGAPANGADFVLGTADRPVNARTVGAIEFAGDKTYAPEPLEWTVDQGAISGGVGHNLDRSAVYDVTVPAGSPKLTFDTKYDLELGWDFGLVQVSTDGGKTYTSLANASTTSKHVSGADGGIVSQLPGFTGVSDAFCSQAFDLSAYAGKSIKLSFRHMTDSATNGNGSDASGWWVKNVRVGDTVVTSGSTLDGARSATQISPIPVAGWQVQAVGWKLDGSVVRYADVKLNQDNAFSLTRSQSRTMFQGADRIAFLVTADDPAETSTRYANYGLTINGELQAGGGGDRAATTGSTLAANKLPISERRSLR